jgi:hypothetical protein
MVIEMVLQEYVIHLSRRGRISILDNLQFDNCLSTLDALPTSVSLSCYIPST